MYNLLWLYVRSERETNYLLIWNLFDAIAILYKRWLNDNNRSSSNILYKKRVQAFNCLTGAGK